MNVLDIQTELTGGESVYCINEAQMRKTRRILENPGEQGEKLRSILSELENSLDRNELAALSFALIQNLNRT